MVSSGAALTVETVVQVEISDAEEDPTPLALEFLYVNGKRVSPPGLCMMTLSYSLAEGRWDFTGWEADVYGWCCCRWSSKDVTRDAFSSSTAPRAAGGTLPPVSNESFARLWTARTTRAQEDNGDARVNIHSCGRLRQAATLTENVR